MHRRRRIHLVSMRRRRIHAYIYLNSTEAREVLLVVLCVYEEEDTCMRRRRIHA
jgi:hypothetical protein